MNAPLSSYPNESYHLGVNLRESRLDIADWYATYISNLDISIKGIRSKRKEPKIVATLNPSATGYVNGATNFVDVNGQPWTVWACAGKLYTWDGTEGGTTGNGHVHEYSGDGFDLHATNRVRFAQAYNKLYLVDGQETLMSFDGTTLERVLGTSPYMPIIPGTLEITDGITVVTDDGAGGLLLDGNVWNGATINYQTGAFSFPYSPWTPSVTVTATWDRAAAQTPETFIRAAQDGSLQYPALSNAPIMPASLGLTDGTTVLASNDTDAGMDYPTGWKQIVTTGGPYGAGSVVGAYDPVTGKLMVTVGVFANSTVITATYRKQQTAITGETLKWDYDPEQNAQWFHGGTLTQDSVTSAKFANTDLVPGSITIHAGTYLGDVDDDGAGAFASWPGDAPSPEINYTAGTFTQSGTPFLPTEQGNITADYSYWAATETTESVGSSDTNGRLYRFKTSQSPLAPVMTSVTDGTHTVSGLPGGSLRDAGNAVVGTLSADGVVVVDTASVFTDASEPYINYFMAEAVVGQTVVNGALVGVLGALIPSGGTDIIWWNERLWVVIGSSIMFSNAYAPETFSQPPLSVSANGELRLCGYSYERLLLFRMGAGAQGEVFYVDVSGAPTAWKAVSVFGGMNFVAPECIVRAANNDSSDVFYPTTEGVRTIKFTMQDRVSGPSLPFTENIRAWWVDGLNHSAFNTAWAVPFNDEFMLFVPSTGKSVPDTVLCYNMKIHRQTQQDGWTRLDMPQGTYTGVDSFCGCVADFGSGNRLYVGSVTGGKIVQMFHSHQGHFTATEISKGITFASPENPSLRFSAHAPRMLFMRTGPDSAAAAVLTATLIDDQDNEYIIGTKTIESSGIVNMVKKLDATYAVGGTSRIPPSKDWRVKLTTTGDIQIQGYEFVAASFKPAGVQLDESNVSASVSDTGIVNSDVADTSI